MNNRKLAKVIAGTIFIVLCIGPFIVDDNIQNYLSWVSAASGLATLIIALFLYDEFDSKKIKFAKQLTSVDIYSAALTDIHLNIFYIPKSDLLIEAPYKVNFNFINFYLNWWQIDNADRYPKEAMVLFSHTALNKILEIHSQINNPWVPSYLVNNVKGVFLYKDYTELKYDNLPGEFVLVGDHREQINLQTRFYRISYDGYSIDCFSELITKFKSILTEIESYYKKAINEVPDFRGH